MQLRTFWKVAQTSLRQQLTYRMALWAGLATNLFFGLLRAVLLVALYGDQASVNGLSLSGSITFIALSQSLIAFLSIFGSWDLMNSVYSGAVGSDLLRPMPFYIYWMGRDLGRSLVNLVGRGVVFMLLFALFYPMDLPSSALTWALFLLSLSLAWLASFSWRFLVNLAAFWSPDARGIGRAGFALAQAFSGFIMPLRLMPDWFSRLCQATPFPAMINTPAEVFLGILPPGALLPALLQQALWVLLLAGACWLALRLGIRRLVIQGG